jgi:hypothetical protein
MITCPRDTRNCYPDLFHAIDVGLCDGPALRLAIGHPRPLLTATLRADW